MHGRSKRDLEDVDIREVRRVPPVRRVRVTCAGPLLVCVSVVSVLAVREQRAELAARVALAGELAARASAADEPFGGLILAVAGEQATGEPLRGQPGRLRARGSTSRPCGDPTHGADANNGPRSDPRHRMGRRPLGRCLFADYDAANDMLLWTSDGRTTTAPRRISDEPNGSVVFLSVGADDGTDCAR